MERALLLTDVVDSTKLVEELGDQAMAALWAAHDRVARDLLPLHDGLEIDKTDGFLLLFERSADAVAYAVAYHKALSALNPPIAARAGLHTGPVILTHNAADDVARGAKPLEVDGLAKPIAARVMSLAVGGQTLVSEDALKSLGSHGLRVESHGHWRIKGLQEPMELFEVGAADAPFTPPPDSEKVHRVVRVGDLWLPVPKPTDDTVISTVGLAGAVVTALLYLVYALGWQWSAILSGEVGSVLSAWVTALSAALALVLVGATAAALSKGPPRLAAMWAGSWAAIGGWCFSGAAIANLMASRSWLNFGLNGGRGIDDLQFRTALSEPIVTAAWAVWGGLLLAPVLGGVLGAVGSELGLKFRRNKPVSVVPNEGMRWAVVVSMMSYGLGFTLLTSVAMEDLQPTVSKALDASATVGSGLLMVGPTLPVVAIVLQVLIANVLTWTLLARGWARGRFGERVFAGLGTAFTVLASATAALALFSMGSGPARVGSLVVAASVAAGAFWTVSSGRLRAPEADFNGGPIEVWIGATTALCLAVAVLAAPTLSYGAGLWLDTGLVPLVEYGSPISAPALLALLDTYWRFQGVVALFVVAGALVIAAFATATGSVGLVRRSVRGFGRLAGMFFTNMVLAVAIFGVGWLTIRSIPREEPAVNWPVAHAPGAKAKGKAYLGAADELLMASPDRALNILEQTEPIWLEAAVFRSLLRELDGVPTGPAWRDTQALALQIPGALSEVVSAWPEDAEGVLLRQSAAVEDPLAQLLRSWLHARHPGATQGRDNDIALNLIEHGHRRNLPYLLAVTSEVGAGVPTEQALIAADKWFDKQRTWTGRLPPAVKAERIWLALRANQDRLALEVVRGLRDSEMEYDVLAATVLDVALRVGDRALEHRAQSALDRSATELRKGYPKPHLRLGGVKRAAMALAGAGRIEEARSLLTSELNVATQQQRTLDAQALAALDHELALAIGRGVSLWADVANGQPPWPLDECGGVAVQALSGDPSALALLSGTETPCHHAGTHRVWRNALSRLNP